MYNGIGLQTARGSGTNGYVQTNKFLVKYRTTSGPPKPPLPGHDDDAGAGLGGMRKPNKEILEHDRKRQVELKLLVLRDMLEEQGYTEVEIEERVEEARRAAEAEAAAAAAEEAGPGKGPQAQRGRGGFTDTQSHHVAARKEKQLEILRDALGLDAEDAKKKGDVESNVESGELVPGKYSIELDTVDQKDNKVSKDGRKDAKKDKKQKLNNKRSHGKRSKKSTDHLDSDSGHEKKKKSSRYDSEDDSESDSDAKKVKKHNKKSHHDSDDDSEDDYYKKEKKHSKKSRHDSDDDFETDRKNANHGKGRRHDSEPDLDSDRGKKKSKDLKNNRDERKKIPVKTSCHDTEDERPRQNKDKDISRHDSEDEKPVRSRYKDNLGHDKKIKNSVKSLRHGSEDAKEPGEILRTDKYHHGFNDERQEQEGKRKGDNSVNIDKPRRYDTDSDSDGYARDRKRQLYDVGAKKNVPERRRVASSSESSDYSGSSMSSSESDDTADSYESQEKRKEMYKHMQRKEERKELEKQKQREEEIKELEKRKELEKQRLREAERMELEKQKQREREEDRHREREQDRHREREPDRRKGGDGAERDYKRKLGEDRYDPNSSSAREDGYMDHQNKDGRRDEERHRSRDIERQDTKRLRYDDCYHRSRDEERYSRDDYRDGRRH